MAAAPADFRPLTTSEAKIKKSGDSAPTLELTQTPDILAELSRDRARPGQVVVGFAAETGDESGSVLDHARAKLARKGCDLLVVNDVRRRSGLRGRRQPGRDPVRRRWPARRTARVEDRAGPRHLGRSGPQAARLTSDRRDHRRHPTETITTPKQEHRHRDRTPLHLRIRHRGTPRQDRRPDQRLGPRRDAPAGPPQPGRRRDPAHHRPRGGRRRGHHHRLRRRQADRARPDPHASATTRRRRASTATRAA